MTMQRSARKKTRVSHPSRSWCIRFLWRGAFILVLFLGADSAPRLWIPFTDIVFFWPWPLYIIFAAFVIVGADNAVNLTDGIDGLAAGVTLPVALFFVFVGIARGDAGVVIFAAALAGGLAAFLIYNFNPAKVFMGDTVPCSSAARWQVWHLHAICR